MVSQLDNLKLDLNNFIKISIHNFLKIYIDINYPWLNDLQFIFHDFGYRDGVCQTNLIIIYAEDEMRSFISDKNTLREPNIYYDRQQKSLFINKGHNFYILTKRPFFEWLIPVIDFCLLKNNASLFHAAAVDIDGDAIILSALGGVGKTSTVISLINNSECKYLGDDYIIIDKKGLCYSFPKPIFFYSYHLNFIHDLNKDNIGKILFLVPQKYLKYTMRISPIVKRLLNPFPNLLQFARKYNIQSNQVLPSSIFKNDILTNISHVKSFVWIQSSDTTYNTHLSELTRDEMIERMIINNFLDLDNIRKKIIITFLEKDKFDIYKFITLKRNILQEAMKDKKLYCLTKGNNTDIKDITETITDIFHLL